MLNYIKFVPQCLNVMNYISILHHLEGKLKWKSKNIQYFTPCMPLHLSIMLLLKFHESQSIEELGYHCIRRKMQ